MKLITALSDRYLSLFTIDVDTGHYMEYISSNEFESLIATKEGNDFFQQATTDAKQYFHPDDIPTFTKHFTKENILHEIKKYGSFAINYRLMLNNTPKHVIMKIVLSQNAGKEILVAGIREWKERTRFMPAHTSV